MKDVRERFSGISEKEKKIYESVMMLLQNGRDINSLTVSEITENAGIGKGTAYGYFKCKEEMVQNAVRYGIYQCIAEISEKMDRQETFEQKYMEILNWMDNTFFEKNISAVLYQLTQNTMQFFGVLKNEIISDPDGKRCILDRIQQMTELGISEGILDAAISRDFQQYTVWASMGSFWMFLNQDDNLEKENRERFKAYLYRCLVQNLNMK